MTRDDKDRELHPNMVSKVEHSTSSQERKSMFDDVPGHSLVMTRVLWGLIFVYETIQYMDSDKIQMLYAPVEEGGPEFQFRYWLFTEDAWPPRISTANFTMLLRMNVALGVMMTFGCFYHFVAAIFFFSSLFIYLQEATFYLNHMYLALVLQFIFIFLPANRMFSIDSKLGLVKRSDTVPRWSVWIIRVIISNVYVWAGIAKVNKDWLLHALPLRYWLPKKVGKYPNLPFFDTLMKSVKVAYFMSWTGCIFDTFLPALLYAGGKWRLTAFAFSLVFHISNMLIFSIGIFPLFCIALSLLFFDYDWPLSVTRFVLVRVCNKAIDEKRFWVETRYRPREQRFSINERLTVVLVLMAATHQSIVPARHFLYKGDVAWNERGHRYSWRMKLRDKPGFIKCAFRMDHADGQPGSYHWEEIPSDKHLGWYQHRKSGGRPELVHQYAYWLGRKYGKVDGDCEDSSSVKPAVVHCFAISSVNCREPQFIINPLFNLAEIPPWSNDDFIIEKLPDNTHPSHPLFPPRPFMYDHKKECSSPKMIESYDNLPFKRVFKIFQVAAEAGLVAKPQTLPVLIEKEVVHFPFDEM